jgi:hypothetical protein
VAIDRFDALGVGELCAAVSTGKLAVNRRRVLRLLGDL